ncbi:MarR family transcriptional regulator [Micromonospora olivasterospora]|uniref:Uncharacterized protein n=2 Tax=Micromonospora olivasterospora TaxID=1880 RepID=A0A562I2D0_MICOL|nr:helix-turn-helix domain-containing protein [Micromonospora olivasterospora]TWH65201.1 hypothetical protein JD77_00136 [Micromonospora olivasterospora]
MSTDPGQPRNQAGDGSGNLGDWATWQGPDMDWQPSPAPSPAVTRTDAGTVHAGDTPHHPADEPPTTTAPLHPDQPQPQPTADSRRVRDRDEARRLFDKHAAHIARETEHRRHLGELWNALIERMDGEGTITASLSALAKATSTEATSTTRPTVQNRMGVLLGSGLLQLVQNGSGRLAAQYRVTDPGEPQQAPLPALPTGSRWVRNRDGARPVFGRHAGRFKMQWRDDLQELWNVLIGRMDDAGMITASESDLTEATSIPRATVHSRIEALRDSGLLQMVQEGHRHAAAQYRVIDPGQPQQAPVPGPALAPDLPQGEDLPRLDDWDTLPMSGPAPAPPAGTNLPGPPDDPDAPTASPWPTGPVPDIDVTHGHGAAIPTNFGQPPTDNQPDDGNRNLGAWATNQEPDMDWQPSRAPSPAVPLHADDTLQHPADQPPTATAPLHPDQPQPQPTAAGGSVRDPDAARTLFDKHAEHIATATQQQPEKLRQLWNALIEQMDGEGNITASPTALANAISTEEQRVVKSTVHNWIAALRDRGLLHQLQKGRGRLPAQYRVTDPGEPQQAPLSALPAGSKWVRNRDRARQVFDQHDGRFAMRRRDDLKRLWNALIDHMDDAGRITASESALADETKTQKQTVGKRIKELRDRGLLQLVKESHSQVAAQYAVSDPGQPRQAPMPGPALGPDRPQGEDLPRRDHGDTSPMPGPESASSAGTGLPGPSGLPRPPDDPDAPTASS